MADARDSWHGVYAQDIDKLIQSIDKDELDFEDFKVYASQVTNRMWAGPYFTPNRGGGA